MKHRGLLKTHTSTVSLIARLLDLLFVVSSALLGHQIYLGHLQLDSEYRVLIGIELLLTFIIFPRFGLYKSRRGQSKFSEVQLVTGAWILTILLLTVYLFVTKTSAYFSRGWMICWLSIGWGLLVLNKLGLRIALDWMRTKGYNSRQIVIVGDGEFADTVIQRLQQSPWLGLQITGQFHDPEFDLSTQSIKVPQLGRISDLPDYLSQHEVDQVWITLPLRAETKVQKIIYDLRFSTVDIRYVPNIFAFRLLNHSISEIEGLPVLNLSFSPMNTLNRIFKQIEDWLISSVILALIWPLLLLISILIKIDSPGPVLFRQKRLGWDGKEIIIYKFRSMYDYTQSGEPFLQAKKNDPRVTKFGHFLRRTSLDELPQFINVLQGRMSIVGPRPHPIALNEEFKPLVQDYMWRHKVKPGITGWAQVNGYRGETDTLEKMKMRVEFDLRYIENWSVWLDIKIILLTILRGFSGEAAY